jgi:biopolymer transport protein ExbB
MKGSAMLIHALIFAASPILADHALAEAPPAPPRDALSRAAGDARQEYDKSVHDLAALRGRIEAEKVPMSRELSSLEQALADLRRRYDETSRTQDTRGLEATNLAAAMKLRLEENAYISNLLDEYARGFDLMLHVSEVPRYAPALEAARVAPQNNDLSQREKIDRQTGLLRASVDRLEDLIGGTRFEGEAVDPKGTVATGEFAMVGPVVLFAAAQGGTAGVAVPQAGSSKAAVRALDETLTKGVHSIVAGGSGLLPLDPTRGGALKELISRGSLIGYFKRGGPIMWPLLFVSILAMTVIFERLTFLTRERRRRDPETIERILACVGVGDVDGAIASGRPSQDFVARSLTYALQHRAKGLSNALMRAAGQELVRFNRGIAILDTCVTMAPLLGLLGTVTGMMASFGMMGGSELGAPAQITGGIAEALIATSFGLGIAVTALIPMNYLHSRSEAARHEIEDASTHLEILMKPIMDVEAAGLAAGTARVRTASVPSAAWGAAPEITTPYGY